MANAQTISVGNIVSPETICEGESLEILPPTITPSSGWTGMWEIAPTTEGPFQPLNSLEDIPFSYDGYYIHYAVLYQGSWYYSNMVRISVLDGVDVVINVNGESVDGDEFEICEGETVTLEAVAADDVNNYPVPGDILCSDNSIVKPADWPAPGKTAIGIVFYVDNTDLHGWAVNLSQSGTLNWSAANTQHITNNVIPDHWRDAIRDLDGFTNSQNVWNYPGSDITTFPAAFTAANYGSGWYLPSAGQLNVLFGEIVRVNESLTLVGGTSIYDNYVGADFLGNVGKLFLWSSTENNAGTSAYALEVLDGQIGSLVKQPPVGSYYVVRAIIDF